MWSPRSKAILAAAAEAAFPEGAPGPSHREAEVPSRFWAWHQELPRREQILVELLLFTVELFALLWTWRPFTWLEPEARRQVMARLKAHRRYPVRLVGESLKGLLTMIHLSSPAVMQHVGVYAVDEHPADPYRLPIRRDGLRVLDDREVA